MLMRMIMWLIKVIYVNENDYVVDQGDQGDHDMMMLLPLASK